MNIQLLFAMENIYESNKAAYGGIMLLLGMLTIFAVLVIIMLSLFAFKYVFHDLPGKKSENVQKEPVVSPPTPVAVHSCDEEVIAAIAAAIAMAESESDGIKFRVVSFRKR